MSNILESTQMHLILVHFVGWDFTTVTTFALYVVESHLHIAIVLGLDLRCIDFIWKTVMEMLPAHFLLFTLQIMYRHFLLKKKKKQLMLKT